MANWGAFAGGMADGWLAQSKAQLQDAEAAYKRQAMQNAAEAADRARQNHAQGLEDRATEAEVAGIKLNALRGSQNVPAPTEAPTPSYRSPTSEAPERPAATPVAADDNAAANPAVNLANPARMALGGPVRTDADPAAVDAPVGTSRIPSSAVGESTQGAGLPVGRGTGEDETQVAAKGGGLTIPKAGSNAKGADKSVQNAVAGAGATPERDIYNALLEKSKTNKSPQMLKAVEAARAAVVAAEDRVEAAKDRQLNRGLTIANTKDAESRARFHNTQTDNLLLGMDEKQFNINVMKSKVAVGAANAGIQALEEKGATPDTPLTDKNIAGEVDNIAAGLQKGHSFMVDGQKAEVKRTNAGLEITMRDEVTGKVNSVRQVRTFGELKQLGQIAGYTANGEAQGSITAAAIADNIVRQTAPDRLKTAVATGKMQAKDAEGLVKFGDATQKLMAMPREYMLTDEGKAEAKAIMDEAAQASPNSVFKTIKRDRVDPKTGEPMLDSSGKVLQEEQQINVLERIYNLRAPSVKSTEMVPRLDGKGKEPLDAETFMGSRVAKGREYFQQAGGNPAVMQKLIQQDFEKMHFVKETAKFYADRAVQQIQAQSKQRALNVVTPDINGDQGGGLRTGQAGAGINTHWTLRNRALGNQ